MPLKIPHVKKGDKVSAANYNRLVDEVNRLQNIAGDQRISVHRNACGIQLSFNSKLLWMPFQVSEDTPENQGYASALRLYYGSDVNNYTADQSDDEILVYDLAALISTTSPLNPTSGAFPNYGTTGPRLLSNWTKQGFVGQARWEAMQGVWVIEWVEHVARWINFSYGGSNQTYSFGSVDSNLSVTNYWHGLDPTKTSFSVSGQTKTNQIAVLNSPGNKFTVKSGDTGTAVWRDDLDNSTYWQYQMVDGGRCAGT